MTNQKKLTAFVLAALAVYACPCGNPASAAEKADDHATGAVDTYELDPVDVEGQRESIPGGMVQEETKLGVLGAQNGMTPDGQPRWNGTLMARYAADEKFGAFARMTYAGAAWTYDEKFKVPSNTVFDLGVTYKTRLGSVPTTFGLTVYNVLDKEYWMASRSDKSLYLSTPRTFALSMAMDL